MSDVSQLWSALSCTSPGLMAHPGLPHGWSLAVGLAMIALLLRYQFTRQSKLGTAQVNWQAQAGVSLLRWEWVTPWLQMILTRPYVLAALRVLAALVFVLVIYAGLFGTPVAERNLATTLTWTWWWTGIVVAVLFAGSAWCAICPWDALATWLTRRRLWRRGEASQSLGLRVPSYLRNIWPALMMFVGLTWLELGMGVTTSSYATAVLALVMVVLATVSLAVFEKKAFCRYFCAIGRTLGVYGQISPVALRPVDTQVCQRCETLACYHGTPDIEPCPTHLVMGRLHENTYCISCGACAQSCTYQNVAWRIRPLVYEAMHEVRASLDQAGFILGLVVLTSFHGLTMLPGWEQTMRALARMIGDSGQLLMSFSLGMVVVLLLPVLVFAGAVWLTGRLLDGKQNGPDRHVQRPQAYRRLFSVLALPLLPLAFSYHLAHNLNHLVREANGFTSVMFNPLGAGALPLSEAERHLRHLQPLLNQEVLSALQAGLLLAGFWLALRLLRQRVTMYTGVPTRQRNWQLWPMQGVIASIASFNLWLLMQPMIMRV